MTAPAHTSTDPFSLFEGALWAVLESFAPLTAIVKANNRINLTGSSDSPFAESSVAGDLPELLLIPTGGTVTERSSTGRTWVQRYALGITTERLRTAVPDAINPVKWATFRALTIAESAGKLKGLPFVISVDFANYTDQLNDPSPIERKIRGWKSVIDVEARFRFSFVELTA